MARPFDPGAALRVKPVGRIGHDRLQSHAEPDQRLAQCRQRCLCLSGKFDEFAGQLGCFGFQAIARFLPAAFIARAAT